MPRGKRTKKETHEDPQEDEEQDEPQQKRSETCKKQLSGQLVRWRFYTQTEILDLVRKLDDKVQISNDPPSLHSIQFSDGTQTFLAFSKIKNQGTHICTPSHISVLLEKSTTFKKSDRVLIFIAPSGNINLQWTVENHSKFPKPFKGAVFTFLLCQLHTSHKLPSDINKIIFSYLNLAHQQDPIYMFVGEGKSTSFSIQEQTGFELSYTISSDNVSLLNTKLERCWKNKYGAWLCFFPKKSTSKFAGYA